MSSNVPIVSRVAWISLIPQLIFMSFLVWLWSVLNADIPIINGCFTYLAISFSLRTFIPRDFNRGIRLVKIEKFQEAIPYFERSYTFFRNNIWLDKYRYLTLLNSSKMSYCELSLGNIGFCYGQMGDIVKAKEYYEKVLQEFPDNGIAKAALRLLNSINGKSVQ